MPSRPMGFRGAAQDGGGLCVLMQDLTPCFPLWRVPLDRHVRGFDCLAVHCWLLALDLELVERWMVCQQAEHY